MTKRAGVGRYTDTGDPPSTDHSFREGTRDGAGTGPDTRVVGEWGGGRDKRGGTDRSYSARSPHLSIVSQCLGLS